MSTGGVLALLGVLVISLSTVTAHPLEHEPREHAVCVYENKTYDGGEKFKPDPCTFCHCPRHGGHEGRVLCAVQDCMWEPSCVRSKKSEDGCCDICLEHGCKHRDGKIYQPRQMITATPCEQCYCPPGGGAVECIRAECPKAENCVNPVQEKGECCHTCPDGPNCWLNGEIIPAGKKVKVDDCHTCECPRHPEQWPSFMRKKGLQALCSMDC